MDPLLIQQDMIKWIQEDIPYWDETVAFQNTSETGAKVIAKQRGMISGTQVVTELARHFKLQIISIVDEGQQVEKGDIIFSISGKSSDLLSFERICLNILSHMSGISTATADLLNVIRSHNSSVRLAATRKTLPGLRKYQKWAVRVAGGDTHRMSLSSMIMLKENHISLYDSIGDAVRSMISSKSFSQKLEVEVRSNEEAIEATKAGADIIMLDNFTPKQISEIADKLRELNPHVLLEASGNIDENSIENYLKCGVDIISMGKLTHSSSVFDMSMIFDSVT